MTPATSCGRFGKLWPVKTIRRTLPMRVPRLSGNGLKRGQRRLTMALIAKFLTLRSFLTVKHSFAKLSKIAWTRELIKQSPCVLLFQADDTEPRLWKLNLRADELPILYVDKRIQNVAMWAKSDPVFMACVLPQVVAEVFRYIFSATKAAPEGGWMREWAAWADRLMPGEVPPYNNEPKEQEVWIDRCNKSQVACNLTCASLNGAGEGNRTLVVCLGSICSTIELHPHRRAVAA